MFARASCLISSFLIVFIWLATPGARGSATGAQAAWQLARPGLCSGPELNVHEKVNVHLHVHAAKICALMDIAPFPVAPALACVR